MASVTAVRSLVVELMASLVIFGAEDAGIKINRGCSVITLKFNRGFSCTLFEFSFKETHSAGKSIICENKFDLILSPWTISLFGEWPSVLTW